VIRHAEKPDDNDSGIDVTGAEDKESLIVQGWQRAGALAVFFGSPKGLPVPDQIYASDPKKDKTPAGKLGSKSKRPLETVTPLAAKLGKGVNVKFAKGEEPDLVAEITTLQGITLVAWQHEAIPEIAKAIVGNGTPIPDPWPGSRFDVVWCFTGSAGQWQFSQVCQLVLAGDMPTPIA
jgi:hypothetical protein